MDNIPSMDTLVNLAKRRGFIFAGSEIYGGLANSWDYGPLGVELKNNIKAAWWKKFVRGRQDVVGIDAAVIMNPKVWEASGHVATFHDPLVECKKCHARFREDQIDSAKPCGSCGKKDGFTSPKQFNLMFKTNLGPSEGSASEVYLRPETAQAMFVDFPQVLASTRKKIPFGIAQIGKAFRNEITPGNFIFRTREFEQMEIEYFIKPQDWEAQFEEWLALMKEWIAFCGIDASKIHDLEVPEGDRAHYSSRTVDIEFDFPFGRGELYGIAYRGDFDLQSHAKASGKDMSYLDPETNETFVPHVIEPTFGVDRTVLAVLVSAYHEEEVKGEMRTVLKLPAQLAPYQAAVLPLMKKPELTSVAKEIVHALAGSMSVEYDETQSIGKRYRRQDEIGTPYCITVDYDSLEDKSVTVRDRDSMEQERVAIEKLPEYLRGKLGQ